MGRKEGNEKAFLGRLQHRSGAANILGYRCYRHGCIAWLGCESSRQLGKGSELFHPAETQQIPIATAGPALVACAVSDMAGPWKCGGEQTACTPGRDISHIVENSDGTFDWTDGVGYHAKITLIDNSVLLVAAGGVVRTGTIDSACRRIKRGLNHYDEAQ